MIAFLCFSAHTADGKAQKLMSFAITSDAFQNVTASWNAAKELHGIFAYHFLDDFYGINGTGTGMGAGTGTETFGRGKNGTTGLLLEVFGHDFV